MLWFLAATVVIFLLISGGYTFFLACRRRKENDWLDEKAMLKTSYGRHFGNIVAGSEWINNHKAQDVWTVSKDGLRLHALWLPAEDPKGTVLLCHGYRSCYLVDFSLAFEMYHSLGLNLLVIDQRSHGKSEGKYITFGVLESEDVRQWIDFHNETFGTQQMILSGMSMGASTVLFLADQKLPENVKGIIADCGFTSPAEIIGREFKKTVHLPAGPSLRVADIFARLLAGFSIYEKDSRRSLAASRLPILMIHGKADHFVPCAMSQAAYAACVSEKTLYLVENASHGVSFLCDPCGYTTQILNFFDQHLEGFR